MELRIVSGPVRLLCAVVVCWAALPAQDPRNPPTAATHFLSGRVVDENGQPMRGAAVGAFGSMSFFDAAKLLAAPPTTTDAEGRYRIAAPDGPYLEVVAAANGRQVSIAGGRYDLRADGMPDVPLLPGAILAGRVRDARGAPLPGARILAVDAVRGGAPMVRSMSGAVTDAEGRFVVPGVARTGLRVTVSARGYYQKLCFATPDAPLEVTLGSAGFVRGRVVDEHGAPLAGITMRAVAAEVHDELAGDLPVSDVDGRFEVTVPHEGPFRIEGSEPMPTTRVFHSAVLRGPADDVVVRATSWLDPDRRIVTVQCIDAASKTPIAVFHACWVQYLAEHTQYVVFHHLEWRRECRDVFQFTPSRTDWAGCGTVVVDAAGHACEITTVPDETTGPLVIALGPESFLTGRVVDEETNEPIAGAAVVALPSSSVPGRVEARLQAAAWTDAAGRYRLGGLRRGDHDVQVFAVDRPASRVGKVQIATTAESTLDLVVPKRRWIEVSLVGNVPTGVPGHLAFRASLEGREGYGNPRVGPSGTIAVGGARTFQFGPFDNGIYAVQLWRPSRVRVGAGTSFDLGTIDPAKGRCDITLPGLANVLVRGRVRLPDDVATERIGVFAQRMGKERAPSWNPRQSGELEVAGLQSDGRFALDLLAGTWLLQLVDLETGIVFHTEAEPLELVDDGKAVEMAPELHWLELDLAASKPDGEVVLDYLSVTMPRPRDASGAIFDFPGTGFGRHFRNGDPTRVEIRRPFRAGATQQRWLVPPGRIEIVTYQMEWVGPSSRQGHIAGSASIDVIEPVHRVSLVIAALPFDEARLFQRLR